MKHKLVVGIAVLAATALTALPAFAWIDLLWWTRR
jgi:hypothetical protein